MSRTSGGDDVRCWDSRQRTDSVFEALSSAHRRRVLFALLDEGRFRVGDAGRANGSGDRTDGAAGFEASRDRLRLLHVDLPKLREDGFVRWDREENVVRRGRRFDDVEPVLRLLVDERNGLDG